MKSLGRRIFVGPRWYQLPLGQAILVIVGGIGAVVVLSALGCW